MPISLIKTTFLSFSLLLNKFLDCGASLSRSVRFDLCPTNPTVTVSFGSRHRWAMRFSRSDGLRCDFSASKPTISKSYMSFCNFNSKLDGRRYDFPFHLNTAVLFPLQNLVQRLCSQTPSSVSWTPNEVSAIPCVLFGNPLRTFRQYLASPGLFLKNRDFSSLIRGDL